MDLKSAALLAVSLVVLGGCRLTVDVSGEGTVTSDNGKINCPADCKAKLKRGKEITLTATATLGSYFAGWKGCQESSGADCIVVGGTNNRRVSAAFNEDKTLEESGLSADLKNCASDNDIDLTNKLSSVTELDCDASTSASFSVEGVGELANLATLLISDVGGGIDSLADLADLNNLVTLKLLNVGLEDATALLDLNEAKLSTLDLSRNPSLSCDDLTSLKEKFTDATVSPAVSVDTCQTP